MSLLEIKLMIILFVKNFEYKLNIEIELNLRSGLTIHPIDDGLILVRKKN